MSIFLGIEIMGLIFMDMIQESYVKIEHWNHIILVPSQNSLQIRWEPAETAGPATCWILISGQQPLWDVQIKR